jgi:hypothetical protein
MRKLVALMATVIALGLTAAPATAAYTPYHQSRYANCQYRYIRSNVPLHAKSWYGGIETIRWTSILYKLTSSGWVRWSGSRPWAYGQVNNSGNLLSVTGGFDFGNWYNSSYTRFETYIAFTNLTPGYYAVKEYYNWVTPKVYRYQWSTFNGPTYTRCRIT